MTRLGSVLVFREGVTKAQAKAALAKLDGVLARDYYVKQDGNKFVTTSTPPVYEFDPADGGPVWYIP